MRERNCRDPRFGPLTALAPSPGPRVLSARDVFELLPLKRAIDLMRQAFSLTSEGRVEQPLRQVLLNSEGMGALGVMPGHMATPERFGAKIVSAFPSGASPALGGHRGVILLFNGENGRLTAIVDAKSITAIRTAAASAAATDVLARADARSLGIFGTGEQARMHVRAISAVRPLDRISVWSQSPERAKQFADDVAVETGLSIRPAEAGETAGADIVCTVTTAADPILKGEWLRAGTHLNVVGSSVITKAEVDTQAVTLSRLFVDYRASALAFGGELQRATAEGAITADHIAGEIGDILLGRVVGRTSPENITMFKSLGMAAEDMIAAEAVIAMAEVRNLGTVIAL